MNNEEKILQLLEEMRIHIKETNSKVDGLDLKLSTQVNKLQLTLENETNRNIGLLVEGYTQNIEKIINLDKIVEDVETIKSDVEIVKKVVTTHSKQLQKLS